MDAAVIGAGAWGTAFAMQLARKGKNVLLWAYESELPAMMKATRENSLYLPGFTLPDTISFTGSLKEAAASSDTIIVATPSFAVRSTLFEIASQLIHKKVLILTKGFEIKTLNNMGQVIDELSGGRVCCAVLSGPSFATEVAKRLFTSVVIASSDRGTSLYFQNIAHDEYFRVYTSEDVVGVELGGALKNVMAIGAGVIQGLGLGYNTLAAYLTRGLAEIKRLGKKMGARETTFMGLSGMGDLILTCTGPLSRNRAFGVELAKGKRPQEILESQKTVVEGYYTIAAAYKLSKSLTIEMPLTEELYRVVYEGKDIKASFEDISKRDIKDEEN
jgi:glycerol-3-phosphate dehydrogenase (NAD(P)+)